MQQTEHIAERDFIGYSKRELPAAETLRVQRHVVVCDACREKLALVFDAQTSFSAVQNNFAFDDFSGELEHLPYEQLALFVDEKLDEVDREIAESHFAICLECAKDLNDLRSYKAIADAPILTNEAKQTTMQVAGKSFWQRLFAFDSIGSFAPVAAAALIAVLFGAWFLIRSNRTDEIAQVDTNVKQPASPSPAIANVISANNSLSNNTLPEASPQPTISPVAPTENLPNQETLFALSDANGQVTVDENNRVKGLENLSPAAQKAVAQSLQTGKVFVSNAANSLGGNGGVLMGGGDESNGVPFGLTTPLGRVIKENQPTLRWKPLKDATDYTVAIVDDKFRVIEESGKLSSTEWRPSKPLPRGTTYSWQVTATRADGSEAVSPASPAPQARFRVLEQATIDDINRLEKSGHRSHLALGVLYAQAGLKQEARREFQALVKANPSSALARKLLAGVR